MPAGVLAQTTDAPSTQSKPSDATPSDAAPPDQATTEATPADTASPDAAPTDAPAADATPAATPASSGEFTLDTPISALIADPAAKAVLDKDLPGMSTDSNLPKFEDKSLRQLQPMTGGQLTDDLLKKTGDDLAAIDQSGAAVSDSDAASDNGATDNNATPADNSAPSSDNAASGASAKPTDGR
jgi:hypothetical protein